MELREAQIRLATLGLYTGRIDNETGPLSRAALKAFQHAHGLKETSLLDAPTDTLLALIPLPKPIITSVPPWLAKAISLIGTLEKPGTGDNPVIIKMAQVCGGQIAKTYVHDSIPWCALFREYCLVSTGFRGIDSLWALDSRKIGKKLSGAAVGAIASKSRDGGGHTFFVAGRDANGRIVGVGGNQSDSVSRATFLDSDCQYNWPLGYPLPTLIGVKNLPIVPSAKFSTKEA